MTETENQKTFAANRATGHIGLSVAAHSGITRRARVDEHGSLRVRFPNATPDALEAVIVNTGGGMTGGDRFTIEMEVGEGASLVAGTAAAEKIYRSTGPDTEMDVRLMLKEGARLAWLPQETILFDRARLSRRIDIDLADGASLVLAEAVVFGRAAMGEAMEQGFFADSLACATRRPFGLRRHRPPRRRHIRPDGRARRRQWRHCDCHCAGRARRRKRA